MGWRRWLLSALGMATALTLACGAAEEGQTPAPAPTSPPAAAVATATPLPISPAPVSQATPSTGPRRGGTLKVTAQASIKSLDCDFTTAYVCGAVHLHYQEGLLALDDNFNPQLVSTWEVSQDGKSYTFTLREGPTFHTGRPITSDDVIASLQRWMKRKPAGKAMSGVLAEPGLVRVNDRTFQINLKQPYAPLLTHLGLLRDRAIMWPKEVAALDPSQDAGVSNYIGTGPYKLATWEVGNRVILERYQGYVPRTDPPSNFAGAQNAYLDQIIWLEIPNEETKIAGLKTGEWDMVDGASLDFYPDLSASPDIGIALDKPGKKSAIVFNVTKPPTDNMKLRQAIQAAIDPEAFMRALGPQDLWTLCATFFHCGTPLESHAGDQHYNQKDPEKARRLLQEAGYKGEPLLYMNPTDYGTITPLGPVFKSQMEAIGVKIDMPGMDWATLISHLQDRSYWNLHSTWHGFYGVHDPITDGWVQGVSENGYKNPRMLELAQQYATSLDPAERTRIVDEIERIAWEEVPYLGIGQFFLTTPYRKWVKNFTVIKAMPNYNNVWLER